MIAVTHAFSRKNAGDGLLVDLTLELLAEAGIPASQCRVLALDAPSFADLPQAVEVPGEPRAQFSASLVGAALELLRAGGGEVGLGGGRVSRMLADARGVVAVGGGYLVADSVVRSGGVLLNHLPQILAAGRAAMPSIYLPQSIGPLRGLAGELTRRALSRIDVIYARDDETLAELQGVTTVRRCPDLAVLSLARRCQAIRTRASSLAPGPVLLVARNLPGAREYRARLRELAGHLDSPLWPVQADVDGSRSDRHFIERLGMPAAGRLASLLEREVPGVVVSVRLHGAIESLLAGWPAIHLCYERKGWGAYQDLGLEAWAHDARRFDPRLVAEQAHALRADPSPMFEQIENRAAKLRAKRRELVAELASRLGAQRANGASKNS